MGRERQKKKNRSSISKVKNNNRGRTKTGKKKVNFLGNDIIAKNWDRSLTLEQNYKNLGLSSKLNAPTGGVEKKRTTEGTIATGEDSDGLAIKPGGGRAKMIKPSETRVERDPETGAILRVIREDNGKPNPLNDPLNDLESSPEPGDTTSRPSRGIVADLEAQADAEAEELGRTKRPRQQSKREEEWIEKMVDAHGDDYTAMFRDRKLNVMQQSEGDIKRRVQKWAKKHGGA